MTNHFADRLHKRALTIGERLGQKPTPTQRQRAVVAIGLINEAGEALAPFQGPMVNKARTALIDAMKALNDGIRE